jgi:hypothetical protein
MTLERYDLPWEGVREPLCGQIRLMTPTTYESMGHALYPRDGWRGVLWCWWIALNSIAGLKNSEFMR